MKNIHKVIGRIMIASLILVNCSITMMATEPTPEVSALVHGNNAFAFDLLREVTKTPENVFFSPYSISSALALTYAGAAGQTADQMARTLRFTMESPHLHAAFSQLHSTLNAPEQGYQLTVANALWSQAGLEVNPGFLATAKRYYDAAFHEVSFVNQPEGTGLLINRWVEQKTNHKIKDLIKPGVITPLTRLVLTNAIYFKGDWELEFDPKRTQAAVFYVTAQKQVPVPMMQRSGRLRYTETNQLQILELPYQGDHLVMDILLPKPGTDLDQVISLLEPNQLDLWLKQLHYNTVQVWLPRFKLETELSLGEILQRMGMVDPFNPNTANFSNMAQEQLSISNVIHKAYVDVNEEGTEAAAATGIVVGTTSLGPPPIVFRADHPFIFLLRDVRSGSILFLGTLHNPI